MQSKQENKISREEIIHYVDNLIEANKNSYDKKLSPLLYEFFLRANEKFEWSREEFLKKYQNFKNNVKTLEVTDMEKVGMPSLWSGGFSFRENSKGIYINEKNIERVKKEPTNKLINVYIIDTLFHECLHATDLIKENEDIKQYGLYHSGNNNEGDTMLNEYANVLSSTLISSDETMYTDDCGIDFTNNGSYGNLKCPGEIVCAALDITEVQLAKLKDKGGDFFYEYLQNKFPYANIEAILDVFKSSLNVIFNASMNKDKENISLGFKNMIDAASNLISNRLEHTLSQGEDRKETLERIYYDIYKCGQIVKSVDRIYELEGNNEVFNSDTLSIGVELEKKVKIYNRFLDNEDLFTLKEKIDIENSRNPEILIESKFDDDYIDLEFNIKEIARKYYVQSDEPLNDNTKLEEYIRKTILKPTIKENISEAINIELEERILEQEKLEKSEMPDIEKSEKLTTKEQEAANFRNSIKYETPIIHNKSTEKQEQQDISRDNEESTR